MKPSSTFVTALLAGLLASGVGAQPVPLVLQQFGGGTLSEPVATGDHAYIGTGAALATWNLAEKPPVLVGTTETPAAGVIRGVEIVGSHLYALWGDVSMRGGIDVYSIADPDRPLRTGVVDYLDGGSGRPGALLASGSLVYVGDEEHGLVVLDASDPLHPRRIGHLEGGYTFDSMHLDEGMLYAFGTSLLGSRVVQVFDVRDPALPAMLGEASMGDSGVVLRSVMFGGYGVSLGLEMQVYDLRDPRNIQQVFNMKIDQAEHAVPVGDFLYVVGDSGVQVWNFGNPTLPTLERTVPMAGFSPATVSATPFGPLVLTRLDRAFLLDIANPMEPTIRSAWALPYGTESAGVANAGALTYVAQQNYGFSIASHADQGTLVGRFDADLPASLQDRAMEDIWVDGDHAYVAAWGFGALIVDVSNPAVPIEAGRFPFVAASAIEAHGNRAYLGSAGNGAFAVLDVSNPVDPVQLGALGAGKTMDLKVRGDHAYLADQSSIGLVGGLRIVDVSNPSEPRLESHETGCLFAGGVEVSDDGNTVFLTCASNREGSGDLRIFDASDKRFPRLLGRVAIPGSEMLPEYNSVQAVVARDGVAYVAHDYGIDEVDVRNPAAPIRLQRHAIAFPVRKLSLAPGGRLHASAMEAGRYVFSLDRIHTNGFD